MWIDAAWLAKEAGREQGVTRSVTDRRRRRGATGCQATLNARPATAADGSRPPQTVR